MQAIRANVIGLVHVSVAVASALPAAGCPQRGFQRFVYICSLFFDNYFEPKGRSKRIEEEKIEQEEERRVGQCGRGRFMYN